MSTLSSAQEPATRPARGLTGEAASSRRVVRALLNALLTLAALLGLLCIGLVVLAVLCGISLIMFKTGSMAPTITAGSVAVVRTIPASEIRVGDVVTVDREAALPVTHRVTSVTGEGAQRTITMRGDANSADDPFPYQVSSVRLTLFSIPGVAHIITALSHPLVLATLTLAASAVVVWSFWPNHTAAPPTSGPPPRHGAAGDHRARHRSGIAGSVLFVSLIAVPVVQDAHAAHAASAATGEEVIHGRHIVLTSIYDPEALSAMRPDLPVNWQVGVQTKNATEGTLRFGLSSETEAPDFFRYNVRACDQRWTANQCSGTVSTLIADTSLAPGPERVLGTKSVTEQTWLLVTVWFDSSSTFASARSALLTVHAHAAGEDLRTDSSALAQTGWEHSGALPALVTGGLAGVLVGAILARTSRGGGRHG